MSGFEAQVARVATEHGDRWIAWRDAGIVAVAQARADAVERVRLAGAHSVVSGKAADVPDRVDWSLLPGGFRGRALRACHAIPRGQVITYAELARRAGSPGAARAAGSVMAANPLPVVIPCHRVVRSDGRLGDYSAGGPGVKRDMLRTEGAVPPGA